MVLINLPHHMEKLSSFSHFNAKLLELTSSHFQLLLQDRSLDLLTDLSAHLFYFIQEQGTITNDQSC